MIDVYLDHLTYAVGERSESVEDAGRRGILVSSPSSLREAGFSTHHYCGDGTTSYDLARRAIEPIRRDLGKVDAVVYATSLPLNGNVGSLATYAATRDVRHLMDFPVSHLMADFELDGALILGVNQLACTSLLGSIRLARDLIVAEDLRRVLCLTSDRFPEGALYEQSYNLISDGAAGCVVSREPRGFRYLAGHSVTNGALSLVSDDELIGSYFTYAHRAITECVAKARLRLDDIHWILPQNLNVVTSQVMSSLLGLDAERTLYPTMGDVAHVISGDNLINLAAVRASGRLRPGDRLLLHMAGYGLNWHTLILEYVS